MRKFLLVLMALCLAVLPCLAESAAPAETAAPVETIDYDFGDFTLTFPAEMPGEIADEITSGAPFVTLYQMDDLEDAFSSNLNVVWTEDASDLSAADPAATAQSRSVPQPPARVHGSGSRQDSSPPTGVASPPASSPPMLSTNSNR